MMLAFAEILAQSSSNRSPPLLVFVIVPAAVVLILMAIALGNRLTRKRREDVVRHLSGKGWTARVAPAKKKMDAEFLAQSAAALSAFPELASRPEGTAWLAFRTTARGVVTLLEHEYATGGGKNRQIHRRTMASVQIGGEMPELTVKEHGIFKKIGELLGVKDIALDNEAFNARYRVWCEDETFAVLLLTPEVQAMLAGCAKPAPVVTARGSAVCLHVPKHLTPEKALALGEMAEELLELIPAEIAEYRVGA